MCELNQELSTKGDELELQGLEGLLFSGGVIRSLTAEHTAEIGQFVNRVFGVEMQPVRNIERELGNMALNSTETNEEEPDMIAATKSDFRRFAAEHGYSDSRACRSWNSLSFTTPHHTTPHDSSRRPADQLPPVRWLNRDSRCGEETIDLRSVHERLVASELRSDSWIRGNNDHVAFLARLVNELVQPEGPLPARRAEWVRNQQNRR